MICNACGHEARSRCLRCGQPLHDGCRCSVCASREAAERPLAVIGQGSSQRELNANDSGILEALTGNLSEETRKVEAIERQGAFVKARPCWSSFWLGFVAGCAVLVMVMAALLGARL